jgi:hypothetical protein
MAGPVSITPKGQLVGRYAKALLIGKGDPVQAQAYAEGQGSGWREVALALKTAVNAGNTDSANWANELAYPIAFDFAEALRPATLIGRMSGFTRIPFNCRMLAAATGTTASWRGEGSPMAVSKPDFDDNGTLEWAGVGAISVFTQELARSANPVIEGTLAQDITRAVALAIDQAFVDPENSGTPGVKPASITSGATAVPSTGAAVANVDADLEDCIEAVGNSDLASAYWCMSPRVATHLSLMRGSSGAPAYPGINARGGSLLGIQVLTSNACGQDANSPGETFIALVVASEILLADDGQARIDFSTEAALQLIDAPSTGAQSQVPLWQNNLLAVKGERAINWRRRLATAAAVITGVTF